LLSAFVRTRMLLQDNVLTNGHWVPFTPRRGTAGAARRERVEFVDEHEVIGVIEHHCTDLQSGAVGSALGPDHVARSQAFFDRYGAATVVLARFVPIVRTIAPVMAGASRMPYRTFAGYDVDLRCGPARA
jgi:hypothetical protein